MTAGQGELASSGDEPLTDDQYRVVSSQIRYTQTTRMDSSGCSYIFVYVHTHTHTRPYMYVTIKRGY